MSMLPRQKIKNVLQELLWTLTSSIISVKEHEKINELRAGIRRLPSLFLDPAAGKAQNAWIANRIELREHILCRDPRNFLHWNVVQRTMFHECKKEELHFMRTQADWLRYQKVLEETPVGNPPHYIHLPKSSGNYIHHAYSLKKFLNVFPEALNQVSTIVEFGGGYGSLARLFLKITAVDRYVIFDVPEFSLLQKFFLSLAFPNVKILTEPTQEKGVIILLSTVEDLKRQIEMTGCDMFIALWSLSESPLSLRSEIWPLVHHSDYMMIAYQKQFEDINNHEYFKKIIADESDVEWKEEAITHLADQSYAFAKKRN